MITLSHKDNESNLIACKAKCSTAANLGMVGWSMLSNKMFLTNIFLKFTAVFNNLQQYILNTNINDS